MVWKKMTSRYIDRKGLCAVWRIFWYALKECTVFKGNVFFDAYFVIEKGIKIGSNFAVYRLMTCIF